MKKKTPTKKTPRKLCNGVSSELVQTMAENIMRLIASGKPVNVETVAEILGDSTK